MPEIKVQCDCGQKFKFDVEPINGQIPFPVICPVCGVDDTQKANELLSRVVSDMASVQNPVVAQVPAVPAGSARLRIHSVAPAPAPAQETPANPPETISPPRPVIGSRPGAAPAIPRKPARKPNFALGMVGAIVGALLGALIYYFVFKYTGFRIGIMAIAVGFLCGLGARLLGGEQSGNELGIIAAALVVGAVVGAQYFVARSWWNEIKGAAISSFSYDAQVTEAKKVIAEIPTGSDQEIRVYLAKEAAEDEKPDLTQITADDIKEFRDNQLPEFRKFAEGKITKQEYDQQHAAELAKLQDTEKTEEGTFNSVFLLLLMSRVGLISLCAAAAMAYKMAS